MAEELSIEKQLENVAEKVKSFATESMAAKAKEVFESEKKSLMDQIDGLKTQLAESKTASDAEKEANKKSIDKLTEDLEQLGTKMNKNEFIGTPGKKKSFQDVVMEGVKAVESEVKSFAKATSGTQMRIQLKAAGDENLDMSNFAGTSYADLTTEQRGLYVAPFAPIWLRTLLPNASTQKDGIRYPRYIGGTGAAAVWDGKPNIDVLTPKPGVSFDFDDITENLKTIAGITRFKREMADDVSWLVPFISQQLVTGDRGLFVAENAAIMATLDGASTAYDGANTLLIEKIYEAAFGQLRDYYMAPSFIIMNSRDVVNEVALNKADTSGLYNLPQGTVLVINGQLTIGGVPVIGLPTAQVAAGTAYVIDRNQTQFVSRLSPELRFFEQDKDNVELNLITARAEERVATLVFNTKAVIKIAAATTT